MESRIILFAIISAILFSRCSDPAPVVHEITIQHQEYDKSIEPANIIMYISVQDTLKIEDLTRQIMAKYDPDKKKMAMIFYFDDSTVAKVWRQKVTDDTYGKVTDAEWKKLDPHYVAVFHRNAKEEDKLSWSHRPN